MPETALPEYDSDRRLLAQNPDTSPDVLDELARDPDRIVQAGVAKHPHAPVSALNRLALSQHWQVRMAVVGNPNTGVQALQYLAEVGSSFSQTTRARHQLFRRGAERLSYQDALTLRAVLEPVDPSERTEMTQPAGSGESGGMPEVLSTGALFQLLETATAYEVRAVDGARGIPTSRYPRDPEGLSAAQAHFSRLQQDTAAQHSEGPVSPMPWRSPVEPDPSGVPPPMPVAAAAPPPSAPSAPPSSPAPKLTIAVESPGQVRRRRWIAGGLITSLAGICVLLIPFIPESNTTLSYSVSAGQGVCSSGLGQFAQALSASAGQSCGEIALGFYVAWAAILCGIGAAIYGLTLS